MPRRQSYNHIPGSPKRNFSRLRSPLYIAIVALAGWIVPGGGFFILNEKKRALIILVTVAITFVLGLYIGSIGVIDPVNSKFWFAVQAPTSLLVFVIGSITAAGHYEVFAKPYEIGQIYTITTGMLNLLCIINAVHKAYIRTTASEEN